MPHNAFWGRSAGQVNVTRVGFAVSYFVSHTCWQPLPQRVISANVNDATAVGIHALRRLKFKRCGELASRLSSRLTFAWVGVAILAIHSSWCISAGLLVYFIQARNISVVFRAIHLTVNMPLQACMAVPLLPGAAKMRVPARGTIPTSICGRVSTAR